MELRTRGISYITKAGHLQKLYFVSASSLIHIKEGYYTDDVKSKRSVKKVAKLLPCSRVIAALKESHTQGAASPYLTTVTRGILQRCLSCFS